MNDPLRRGKSIISCGVIACFLLGGAEVSFGEETQTEKKQHIVKTEEKKKTEQPYKPAYPEETKSDSGAKQWWIVGGAAAVGLGAALALGGGGGDDAPACELPPVGPSISGNDWVGRLRLIDEGSQDVVAEVFQCGEAISITTGTALPYGQVFVGRISSSGFINVTDQTTLETWTTFKGRASSTSLRIFDFVKNQTALDSLELAR